jgi:DNA replication protein DnaC
MTTPRQSSALIVAESNAKRWTGLNSEEFDLHLDAIERKFGTIEALDRIRLWDIAFRAAKNAKVCHRPECKTPVPLESYKGWAPVLQHGHWVEREFCEEHRAEQLEEARRRRVLAFVEPYPRMHFWSLATFPADEVVGMAAKKAAVDWLENENGLEGNLYIYGPVGSGKTGLAWATALHVVESELSDEIRFCNVRQLLTGIRRSFGTEEANDPTDELVEAWVVVLDDLGAERVTDWTREWLATLIEGRYVNERPTIVTANYSPSQLARRLGHDDPILGKRIVSRLTEGAIQIKLDRADLRLRKAA